MVNYFVNKGNVYIVKRQLFFFPEVKIANLVTV